MTTAIEALGIGKEYVRGTGQNPISQSLRDVVSGWARGIGTRAMPDRARGGSERFWALQDVSFSIKQGEVVGIIGRNGSGKSTLLKIVSQITAPTTGEVRLNGRTGTLLEVGTGFHPELTGRENVFLNGTILGMERDEIRRKFNEIVAFSGIESFIDTPVKRYSSGMQMRLAFAVAAHLDPEILVVDEVLAVGDAEFQKKCLAKMDDFSKGGRTILFVSHNMAAIDQLCQRVIWLDGGRVVEESSDTYELTSRYLFGDEDRSAVKGEWRPSPSERLENAYFLLSSFRVRDVNGGTINAPVSNDEQAIVEIDLTVRKTHSAMTFGYAMTNEAGTCVFWTSTTDDLTEHRPKIGLGRVLLTSPIPRRLLNDGLFRLDFLAAIHSEEWFSEPNQTHIAAFLRISGALRESRYWAGGRPGVMVPLLAWEATTP
jgi:lipopolysaccharide transport system ATP-binding protein